jgi:hypothetical protein
VGLLLRVVEVRDGGLGWRWLLTDEDSGTPLADHTVALDPTRPSAEAFGDLHRYLRWRADPADPGRRAEHEAALLAEIGEWVGEQVLGRSIGRAIVSAAEPTVRVEVPPEAEFLLFRPLELAYVDGVPLARRGVSLVYALGPPGPAKRPIGGRLRMVAVFSLPTESTALGLRRERYALTRLIRRLGARRGRAVDLEVLQYGVTRGRLREAMTADGGPDVLHISGHGRTGELLLEYPDGSADPVPAAELLGLLGPARGRVKLAVVSACESAAGRVAETLGLLGLADAAAEAEQQARAEVPPAPEAGIAHRLARELDCAVVAMRYPVSDEFAIALADQLYDGLYRLDLPLVRALPRAVSGAAGDASSLSRPAISIATPTLFGTRALGLSLTPPRRRPDLDPDEPRMAYFPPEPQRFVGRARALAEATTALAPESDHTAVLFHGMAGAGKTACALELAYRHRGEFAGGLVFWQAPTRDDQFGGALASLALALEQQLGRRFAMVDKITTVESLRAFLPRLSSLLAENGLLLVLDNLETLLTAAGGWRDPRWTDLIATLTGHGGESRTILTSRIRPALLDGQVLVEPVLALSRDEAAVLVRELPHLRALLHIGPDPERGQHTDASADRAIVTEVLHLVQGHPKLLELADAAAADRPALDLHLAAARATADAHGAPLAAFLGQGRSGLDADGFLEMLTAWTNSTVATLPGDARLLYQLLCLIEDGDRDSMVVEGNWAGLWRHLDRPGDPPESSALLPMLTATALVHADGGENVVRYRIHPGVAEAVRSHAPDGLAAAVDGVLSAWWAAIALHAMDREGGEHTQAVVHAGLAAAPYLLRRHDWAIAAYLLEQAVRRDETPAVAQAVLPHLHHIATITGEHRHLGLFAEVLATVDPAEAERLLRYLVDQAVATQDHSIASTAGGYLADLLRQTGRLAEALTVADRQVEHARLAGRGPWTQLANRNRRLQILHLLGQREQVLAEVDTLREQMRTLPDQRAPDDAVNPWRVREATLTTGVFAARDLGRWQHALDLNADVLVSVRRRNAGDHTIARIRFNDFGSLLALGRLEEADTLLRGCQHAFEHYQDTSMLGHVLSARGNLASRCGRHAEAADFARTALRLAYIHADAHAVATSHHNLASSIAAGGADPDGSVAHWVAASLIRYLTGMRRELDGSVRALAGDLRALGVQVPLPTSVDELAAQVERVEGVHFGRLVRALVPDPGEAEAALTEIVRVAHDLPDGQIYDLQGHLDQWGPGITAMAAAVGGDKEAATATGQLLDQLAGTDDWGALADVLRRILAGERDAQALVVGLDPIDTAIVEATLDRLGAGANAEEEGRVNESDDLVAMVDRLPDREAVRVLALVVDHSGPLPDGGQLRQIEERLREAVADPELDRYADPAGPPDQPSDQAGALARTVLAHLAATPPHDDVVRRAIGIATGDTSRFVDPGTLAVGALVLLALQTEVELTRSSTGRWRLRVHKARMSDSTFGALLTRLVGLFRNPG